MNKARRSYWQEAARQIKRAFVSRRTREIAGCRFKVAYESRPHRFQGRTDDFVMLRRFARGARCVLDIGGHLGLAALVMQRGADREARIIMFEPSEEACIIALENCELNDADNIEVINCLVGDSRRRIEQFQWNHSSDRSGIKGTPFGSFIPLGKAVISIDEFVAEQRVVPDAVKIDVEGAEVDVLAGMVSTMSEARPRVVVEVHAWREQALYAQMSMIIDLANRVDYQVIDIQTSARVSDATEYSSIGVPDTVDAQARVLLLPDGQQAHEWLTSTLSH